MKFPIYGVQKGDKSNVTQKLLKKWNRIFRRNFPCSCQWAKAKGQHDSAKRYRLRSAKTLFDTASRKKESYKHSTKESHTVVGIRRPQLCNQSWWCMRSIFKRTFVCSVFSRIFDRATKIPMSSATWLRRRHVHAREPLRSDFRITRDI